MILDLWAIVACAMLPSAYDAAEATAVAPGVYVLDGGVRTGVFVRDGAALLIDCPEKVTPERLKALGVDRVEIVCMTQHRRPNAMGAYRFVDDQNAQVVVSERDRPLFEDTAAYWNDWRNRWHIYHTQPGPQVLPRPLKVARTVKDGDTVEWRGLTLHVLETPGATEGALSYRVDVDGKRLAFIGDVMCGPGQIPDLYSLQKGFRKVGDYHGFLGMREPLLGSLHKLAAQDPELAIPSHGAPFGDFKAAAGLLERRLDALFRNYVSISALNHYFPSQFEDMKDDPERMPHAEQLTPPDWVRRVAFTSFAVVSESGDALLVDCGHDSVLNKLDEWRNDGTLKSLEGCWVTHYHDDHVDSLHRLATRGCPITTDARMAEILEHPDRFYLPCIAPTPIPVAHKTADGESWQWREFKLTAFHFPGQTLYHGGLLVEGRGAKVFFAGDSGAPTGLDDYCAGNRTFLGPGRGSRRCLDIWRTVRPDFIFNQHQDKPFRFTDAELDRMDRVVAEREDLIKAMIPWEEADFAVDESWVRAYPYEQECVPGATVTIQVHVTNHARTPASLAARPVLPAGWEWLRESGTASREAPPRTDGWVAPGATQPDAVLSLVIRVPSDAAPGLYAVPLSLTYRDRELDAFRHARVRIR